MVTSTTRRSGPRTVVSRREGGRAVIRGGENTAAAAGSAAAAAHSVDIARAIAASVSYRDQLNFLEEPVEGVHPLLAYVGVASTLVALAAQVTDGAGSFDITILVDEVAEHGPLTIDGTLTNDVIAVDAPEGSKVEIEVSDLTGTVNSAFVQITHRPVAPDLIASLSESFPVACSDEVTAITTGTGKVTFRMPYAFTLTEVQGSMTTAPTGSSAIFDINKNGASIFSTRLSIDAGEKTSLTAAAPPVISTTSIAKGDEITADFDQIGSSVAGTGVKVYLIGNRA